MKVLIRLPLRPESQRCADTSAFLPKMLQTNELVFHNLANIMKIYHFCTKTTMKKAMRSQLREFKNEFRDANHLVQNLEIDALQTFRQSQGYMR